MNRIGKTVVSLIAACAVLGSASTLATAAPQGPWVLPASDLSVPGKSTFNPVLAVAPDATATAVWQRFDGTSTIRSATRPPGGIFGPPVDLSVSGQNAFSPQITTAPDGTATAVWPRSDGANTIVQAATRPPGGSFGTPVNLSAAGQDVFPPQIATAPDGTATAVWPRSDGANTIIQAATRPPGGSFGTPVNLSAPGQNASEPQIATAPDGTTTVVWERASFIQAATRPPGGSFGVPVDVSALGNFSKNQIATAPDGTTTVVWRLSPISDPGFVIQAATRPPGGSFGAPVDVSASGQQISSSRITTAPDGTTTVVWDRSDGVNLIIQASTRTPGGSFGAPVDLSASGQDAENPRIAAGPDGTATAVWEREDGANNRIQAASTAQPSFLLQAEISGNGTGTVSSEPSGIACGNDCAEVFPSFTDVTLTATPDAGSTFTGWTGAGCSGTGSCEVTVSEAITVTAEFTTDPPPPAGKPRLSNLKIKPKSKKVRRGKKTTFKVRVKNTGDATAKNLKLCAKGPKKLVKVPKCRKPGKLAAGKSKTVKFKVKVKKRARKGKKAKLTFTATAKGSKKKSGKATAKIR